MAIHKDPRWRERSPNESEDGSSDDYDLAPQDYKPDLFRSMPLDTLGDIYIAAGDAARQMPQLKIMELEASIPRIDGLEHVLGCCPSHKFKYDRPSGAATWISSSEFHVTERMRETWDVAAKAHGHFQVSRFVLRNHLYFSGFVCFLLILSLFENAELQRL